MMTMSVIYPYEEGARFDFAYYVQTHLPLARRIWGDALVGSEALKGLAGADGGNPAYTAIVLLRFASAEACQAALTDPGNAELAADIARFTTLTPSVQLNGTAL